MHSIQCPSMCHQFSHVMKASQALPAPTPFPFACAPKKGGGGGGGGESLGMRLNMQRFVLHVWSVHGSILIRCIKGVRGSVLGSSTIDLTCDLYYC